MCKKKNNDINIRIISSSLVTTIGRGITLPFLPIFLHNQLSVDILDTGNILTAAMVAGLFLSVPLGNLAKKFKNSVSIKLSLIVFMLSFMLIVFFKYPFVFAISFTAINLSYSVFSVIIKCFISENISGDEKTRLFSLNYTFINIGWVIGPLIGSWLLSRSVDTPFYLSSLTGLIAIIICFNLKDGSSILDHPKTSEDNVISRFSNWKKISFYLLSFFLTSFIFGRFASCISQVLMVDLNSKETASIVSSLVTTNAITVILFQYVVGRRINNIENRKGFSIGILSLLLGLVVFEFSRLNHFMWCMGMVIFSLGEIIIAPLQYKVIDSLSRRENRSLLFSLQNFSSIGGAANPALTALIITFWNPNAVYYSLMIAAFLSLLLFFIGFHQKKDDEITYE